MAGSLQPEDLLDPEEKRPNDLRSVLVTSVLNLEPLDKDLFRGSHHWVPTTQRLFGGQIVGQALVAAATSVSDEEFVHSLHCYFVRAGDPKVPVLYQVERTRDGRSFSVRSVKAVQHGVPILTCQASFHRSQESPLTASVPYANRPFPRRAAHPGGAYIQILKAHQGLSKRDMASDLNSSQFYIEKVKRRSFTSKFCGAPKKWFTPTYGVSAYSGEIA
ncbi:unnamed protein product [Ranitomeya imitator]|uniref:Acyl-CoA thioesterase-like N-terminal HotDog domain-containing protein n=1 Tax=Ranitomeya imitator TaxID=111125 RepID=A0ABN9M2I0_9NEOB|nr:unnamed protein product [Ranitomeya imitator]